MGLIFKQWSCVSYVLCTKRRSANSTEYSRNYIFIKWTVHLTFCYQHCLLCILPLTQFRLESLYPYTLVGGKNVLTANSWNVHRIDLKLCAKVYKNKNFLKMSKMICPLSESYWRQHFFYSNYWLSEKSRFSKILV